jgi:hypothetical protein
MKKRHPLKVAFHVNIQEDCPSWARTRTLLIQNVAEQNARMTDFSVPPFPYTNTMVTLRLWSGLWSRPDRSVVSSVECSGNYNVQSMKCQKQA